MLKYILMIFETNNLPETLIPHDHAFPVVPITAEDGRAELLVRSNAWAHSVVEKAAMAGMNFIGTEIDQAQARSDADEPVVREMIAGKQRIIGAVQETVVFGLRNSRRPEQVHGLDMLMEADAAEAIMDGLRIMQLRGYVAEPNSDDAHDGCQAETLLGYIKKARTARQ
jgi:hypothetical protein